MKFNFEGNIKFNSVAISYLEILKFVLINLPVYFLLCDYDETDIPVRVQSKYLGNYLFANFNLTSLVIILSYIQ